MDILILTGGVGLLTGVMSGLIGIGGGIVMAPLLLFLPGWLGLDPLAMRDVAGLTIIQGLSACLSGAIAHKKLHFVSDKLTLWMGTTIFFSAFLGGASSGYVPNAVLLIVFALMAMFAAILMILPDMSDSENPDVELLSFSTQKAVLTAGGVGVLGGLVGQGGSFILIPLMINFVKIPTRIAIGSNLAIVFLSSLAAFIGKAYTGQILWHLAIPIVITAIPGAYLGSLVSRKIPIVYLRQILAVCIGLAAVRIVFCALSGN